MLEGNRFLPLAGTPILWMARISALLAVWLPEPLTVATVIEKSLTIGARAAAGPDWGRVWGASMGVTSLDKRNFAGWRSPNVTQLYHRKKRTSEVLQSTSEVFA